MSDGSLVGIRICLGACMTVRVLALGHSASRTGSPKVFAAVLGWLGSQPGTHLDVALAQGGPLLELISSSVSSVRVHDELANDHRATSAASLLYALQLDHFAYRAGERIRQRGRVSPEGYDVVYVNSVSALSLLRKGSRRPPIVLHVHELDVAVMSSRLPDAEPLSEAADRFIAVSKSVRDMLVERHGIDPDCVVLAHECLLDSDIARERMGKEPARTTLGLSPDRGLVLGCGTLEWRKGDDLFLATAISFFKANPDSPTEWVWVGAIDERTTTIFEREIVKAGLVGRVRLIRSVPDIHLWQAAADMLFMCSREDPYPLVVLEAALSGRPVVCQRNAGGAAEFVSRGAGVVCDYLDVQEMAQAIQRLLDRPQEADELGSRGRQLVMSEHTVADTAEVVYAELVRMGTTRVEAGTDQRRTL